MYLKIKRKINKQINILVLTTVNLRTIYHILMYLILTKFLGGMESKQYGSIFWIL
jgi:hypothetical protein